MPSTKEAVRTMSDFVNNMCHDPQEFVDLMAREHRTLQQCFTNLCFRWIRKCAEQGEEGNFDLRNEYSCQKSAEIVKAVDVHDCPFI